MPELFGVEYAHIDHEIFINDDYENYISLCSTIDKNDMLNLAYTAGNAFLLYNITSVDVPTTTPIDEFGQHAYIHDNNYHYHINITDMLKLLDDNIVQQIFAQKYAYLDDLLAKSLTGNKVKSARNI